MEMDQLIVYENSGLYFPLKLMALRTTLLEHS